MPLRLLTSLIFLFMAGVLHANPEPDIPVQCAFAADGTVEVSVEVDPRCFTAEPMLERWFMKVDLTTQPPEALDALKQQVKDALARWLRFETDPVSAPLQPQWTLSFTGLGGVELVQFDDPVVVKAVWKLTLPPTVNRWRVTAAKDGRFSVVVRHRVHGKEQPRTATLFPGESSYWLDLPEQ